ncbi:serine hydrolase [Streptomyces sp. NPDC057280]|uniref:serine hydrolase n=1 Tax=Streptomyces sp. NPDC057280 TaxID=3346081 RepID=UPI003641C3FB
MSDHSRSLPDRPNLRYLKTEAKRRLRSGEFTTLHEAQLTVAREHGAPSWAALKRLVEDRAVPPRRHASRQLRWIAARFADADAPAEEELREHVHERLLEAMPPEELLPRLMKLAPRLHGPGTSALSLVEDTPTHALARLDSAGLAAVAQLQVVVEPTPPHRLVGFRVHPAAAIDDPRLTAPGTRTEGHIPPVAVEVAEEVFAEFGLPGLALASAGPRDTAWALARGWAALEDPSEPLTTRHRFPAGCVTTLVTATAVLRLVADGRVGLDDPADRHLHTVRLADPAVTVRELLSHTGGVDTPPAWLADRVPDPTALFGRVIPCGGPRGRYADSDAGYFALGLLVENLTGSPFPQAATDLVLRPLGMADSCFPDHWPARADADTVTGYAAFEDGTLIPRHRVSTMPAAGGLWTTAPDLVRFGLSWSTLLPGELARQALTPQAALPGTGHTGLGWELDRTADTAGHTGHLPGASAALAVRLRDGRVHATLTNRSTPLEPINGRLLRALP